jgi:hypothetical protein
MKSSLTFALSLFASPMLYAMEGNPLPITGHENLNGLALSSSQPILGKLPLENPYMAFFEYVKATESELFDAKPSLDGGDALSIKLFDPTPVTLKYPSTQEEWASYIPLIQGYKTSLGKLVEKYHQLKKKNQWKNEKRNAQIIQESLKTLYALGGLIFPPQTFVRKVKLMDQALYTGTIPT